MTRHLIGALLLAALGAGAAAAAIAKSDQKIAVTVHAPATAAYNTAFSVAANSLDAVSNLNTGLAVTFSSAGSCKIGRAHV